LRVRQACQWSDAEGRNPGACQYSQHHRAEAARVAMQRHLNLMCGASQSREARGLVRCGFGSFVQLG
jgi:hypothetical protein